MRRNIFLFVFVAAVLVMAGFVLLGDSQNSESDQEKISVLVSILPQKEFVESVGGGKVEVHELVRPGESPATYSLTASDLRNIESSDIYFRIGYIPFEKANIDAIEDTNSGMKIVDIPENLSLRYFGEEEEHEHEDEHEREEKSEGYDHENESEDHESENDEHTHEHEEKEVDPHLWLSIENVKLHVRSIADKLSEIDEENADYYSANADEYIEELEELKADISAQLSDSTGDHLLVFHPAWGYFADEFGLEQIAIEQDGNNPTAERIQEIVEFARENDVKIIFVQEQFSTEAAESIAEELEISVVSIDPLAEDYIDNMRKVSSEIGKSL
ncbi:ABC transporter substrate-binding protein [Candidatus Dojkabacteria bacterium]|nr:ABC transporter substrate-binding protein [Candidatus Dojkabacteria bacterium]